MQTDSNAEARRLAETRRADQRHAQAEVTTDFTDATDVFYPRHPRHPWLKIVSARARVGLSQGSRIFVFAFLCAPLRLCVKAFSPPLLRSSLCALCVLLWQSALAEVHYVDVNSTNATPPYTNWATAATNIQDAVDAAVARDEIVVTNGTYAPVNVPKPIAVRSVSGPQSTIINGGGSVPCVYLTNNASLYGLTLTNGFSFSGGSGVWCGSSSAVVSNCVLTANFARSGGGGALGGTLNNCTLSGNSSQGVDGAGGASYATLNNCTLTGNSAYYSGGAYGCTLNNCTLTGNTNVGAVYCALSNCSLTGNSGGGTIRSTLNNCILFRNGRDSDWQSPGSLVGNNWFGNPMFVDTNNWANLRLQSNPPVSMPATMPTRPPVPTWTATRASRAARWTSARMNFRSSATIKIGRSRQHLSRSTAVKTAVLLNKSLKRAGACA